jgi:hypothetical protein
MRYLIVLLLAVLPACALIPQTAKDKAVAVAVDGCTKFSLVERGILRQEINLQLNPKNITWCGIRCPGDPPPAVQGCQ